MNAVAMDGVRLVEHRLVPDPMMTDAEYFEQRRTKSGPLVGKVSASMNMVELIGGLARIKDRTEVQEAAAGRFRLLHERAQIGGARAIDYGVARVDTSGSNYGLVVEFGEEARRAYSDAVRYLGMIRSSLVERVVVYDMSLRQVEPGRRAQIKAKAALFDALDDLAVHFRFVARPRA